MERFFMPTCYNITEKLLKEIPALFYKIGYQMNTSSWPMFLLRTLTGSEMAPEAFFKKVRKML